MIARRRLFAPSVAALYAPVITPASIALVDQAADSADATSYTFSARSFGAAASNRAIVVGVSTRNSDSIQRRISSATIGGVSATIFRQDGGTDDDTAIIGAAIPTGTSGDIAITWDGITSRCGINVWRVLGVDLATFTGNGYYSGGSTPTVPGSLNLNTYANGVVVGVACSADASGSPSAALSWSGLTQEAQQTLELFSGVAIITARGASAAVGVAETPRSVSINCAWGGTAFGIAATAVAFAPAA